MLETENSLPEIPKSTWQTEDIIVQKVVCSLVSNSNPHPMPIIVPIPALSPSVQFMVSF